MSRHWGHGHSTLLGGLLMLALIRGEYLWTLTAAFVLGVALGRGWGVLAALLRRGLRDAWPVIEGRARRSR